MVVLCHDPNFPGIRVPVFFWPEDPKAGSIRLVACWCAKGQAHSKASRTRE